MKTFFRIQMIMMTSQIMMTMTPPIMTSPMTLPLMMTSPMMTSLIFHQKRMVGVEPLFRKMRVRLEGRPKVQAKVPFWQKN